jgi:hypothetical protein
MRTYVLSKKGRQSEKILIKGPPQLTTMKACTCKGKDKGYTILVMDHSLLLLSTLALLNHFKALP